MSLQILHSPTAAAVAAATDQVTQRAKLLEQFGTADVTVRSFNGATLRDTVTYGAWVLDSNTPRGAKLGPLLARTVTTTGEPTSFVFRAGATDIFSLSAAVSPGIADIVLPAGSGGISALSRTNLADQVLGQMTISANPALPVAVAVATALNISFPPTGFNGVDVVVVVTPNGTIPPGGLSAVLSVSNGGVLGLTSLSFTAGSNTPQTTTLRRNTSGTSVVTMTNTGGLMNTGSGASYVSEMQTVSPPATTRLTSPTLFVDVKASTAVTGGDFGGAIVIPAKAGVAGPKDDFLVGVFGPHNDFVDIYAGWRWRNPGGDWIDANGTWQGTAAPHFTFTANTVTSGSAPYPGVVCTEAAKAAYWRGKWNAFIVKCVGGQRAIAALHHPTLAAPVMRVTYTDATTADLDCLACVRLASGSAYTHIGAEQAVISNSVALEFEMPTKEVASAVIDFVVSSHDASPATISGYTVNPPTASGVEEFGIAENYEEDVGLESHPSVLFFQRYTDGTTLGDYVIQSPSGVDSGAFSNWSPVVYGGVDDPTKLPTAIGGAQVAKSNKWFQVNSPSAGGGFSIVDSSYTGEGFVPFGPGRGAMRIVLPAATVADGGTIGNFSSVLAADLRHMFDKAICGKLDEIWVRQEWRFAWAPKTLAATKMLREVGGSSAEYSIPKGKFGIGPHHAGPYGGNSNTGGNNLGHSERPGFMSLTDDFTNAATYVYGHTQDMLPDRDNTPFGTNGLGAGFFVNQNYVVENRIKLNTYNPTGAIGTSAADGEIETWINGVPAGKVTGLKYRDGAINYTTTPNGPTYIAPFGDLGFTGLWLNNFSGGTLPPDTDLVMFIGGVCAATEYIGRTAPALPSWVPAPGEVREITVANGLASNRFRSQAAPYHEPFYTADIVSNYSGGVVNNFRGVYGVVVNEGSGHGNTNDNTVIEQVPAFGTVGFERITNPTPLFGNGTDVTTRANNSTGNPTLAGLVDKVKGSYTMDGQPMSRHSYGAQTIVPPHHMGGAAYGAFLRLLWNGSTYQYLAAGGEAAYRIDFTNASGLATYRKAGEPRISGDFADVPFAPVSAPMWQAHVPKQNRVYLEAHAGDYAPRWFDLTLGRYFTGTGTSLTNRVQGNGGRLLSVDWLDLVLMVDRDASNHVQVRMLDVSSLNPSWNNTPRTLSSTLTVDDDWSEVTVDVRRKCLLVGNANSDATGVYRIDFPAVLSDPWTVTREPFGAAQSIDWTNMTGQTYGRFDGLDKLRGTRLVMTRASKDATGDSAGVEKTFAWRPASTIPQWISSHTVSTWGDIPASNTLAALNPDNDPAVNPNHPGTAPWRSTGNFATMVTAWCGMSFDEVGGKAYWADTGGHNDKHDNGFYSYDLNRPTPLYTRVLNPSGSVGMPAVAYPEIAGLASGDYSDGRGRSKHTYNYAFYLPGYGPGLATEVAISPSGGTPTNLRMQLFNENTGARTTYAALNNELGSGCAACVDTQRGVVWKRPVGNAQLNYWNPVTNTWTAVGGFQNLSGPWSLSYLPGHDCILMGNGSDDGLGQSVAGGWQVFDCATGTYYTPTFTGAPSLGSPNANGLWPGMCQPRWAASLGCFLAWDNSSNTTKVMTITPPANPRTGTWVIGELAVSGSNTVTPSVAASNGTYGRFFVWDAVGICGVINSVNEAGYFFRYR